MAMPVTPFFDVENSRIAASLSATSLIDGTSQTMTLPEASLQTETARLKSCVLFTRTLKFLSFLVTRRRATQLEKFLSLLLHVVRHRATDFSLFV
jgi:hypothetical protein